MAITETVVKAGTYTYTTDLTATADADTTFDITHGLGATPVKVTLTPIEQATAALSLWAATTIDNTKVTVTKATTAGSGGANPQVRAIIELPHSITE